MALSKEDYAEVKSILPTMDYVDVDDMKGFKCAMYDCSIDAQSNMIIINGKNCVMDIEIGYLKSATVTMDHKFNETVQEVVLVDNSGKYYTFTYR